MPAQQLQTDALVLLKKPPADRFQQLTVLSADHGLLLCLRRVPVKSAATTVALDLFDEADLWLESSNQGRTWFVREARVLARHDAIGRSYDALRHASALANVIARNPVSEDSRSRVHALVRQTLAAFASTVRPDVAFFKALYCFARDEGYPVKQDWLRGLPEADAAAAAAVLNQPLAAQSTEPPLVERLTGRLKDYLRGHTEILLE